MMRSTSPEVRELIPRIAAHPRGLDFLGRGDLECVAITFRARPEVILEVRRILTSPAEQKWLLEAVRRSQEQTERARTSRHARSREAMVAPHPPRCTRELIRAAQSHELGFSFLMDAPPETVAVVFHVHPGLVFRAREVVSRCLRMQASRRKAGSPAARARPWIPKTNDP